MSSVKFSTNHVAGLTPRPAAYIDYDPDLPGFGVRIAPRGTRSWIVEFRPNGGGRKQPTQRMTMDMRVRYRWRRRARRQRKFWRRCAWAATRHVNERTAVRL
jgi:hypothetical protein